MHTKTFKRGKVIMVRLQHGANSLRLASILLLIIGASTVLAQTTSEQERSDLVRRAMEMVDVDGPYEVLQEQLASLSYDRPLLNQAVEIESIELIETLLDAGADIDRQELWTGLTPVMVAAEQGNLEIVQLLIDRGADLSIVGSPDTFTALAIESGLLPENAVLPESERGDPDEEVSQDKLDSLLREAFADVDRYRIETLLSLGADISSRDEDGRNALMYFVAGSAKPDTNSSPEEIFQWYFSFYDGDFDEVDADGNTALGIAILLGAPSEITSFLIERSDMNHRNDAGLTYYDLAERSAHNELWKPERLHYPTVPNIEISLKPVMTTADWDAVRSDLDRLQLYKEPARPLQPDTLKRALLVYFKVILDDFQAAGTETCDRALSQFQDYFMHYPGKDIEFFGRKNAYSSKSADSRRGEVMIRNGGDTLHCSIGDSPLRVNDIFFSLGEHYGIRVRQDPNCDDPSDLSWRTIVYGTGSYKVADSDETVAGNLHCRREIVGVSNSEYHFGQHTLVVWGEY